MLRAGPIYLCKVYYRDARARCEICFKLTKRHQSDVIELVPVASLLTSKLFLCFGVSISVLSK